MKELIRSKFEAYWDEMMTDLSSLISINSIRGKTTAEFPFGKEPARALSVALEQARRMGFTVENVDNYAGTIDMGEGNEMVGVMAHLDIVPAGTGWTSDPFVLSFRDGRLYGRGVVDDKGPAIAALYGMRILKDLGIPLKKKIRLILGTNEEQGSGCMKYYAQHRPIPDYGFTPDADYPLIFAEKGNFWTYLSFPVEKTPVLEMSGGESFNAVPSLCTVLLDASQIDLDALMKSVRSEDTLDYAAEFSEADGKIRMVVKGRAAHGSTPEKGVNAVVSAAKILVNFLGARAGSMLTFVAEQIGRAGDGSALGLANSDEISGKLSLNLGKINYSAEHRDLAIDIRYPVSMTLEQMTDAYQKMADQYGLKFDIVESSSPHYVSKDHPLVQKLLKVYREKTGDMSADAIAIGGGTYAKALGGNFVAFGPEFPGSEPMNVHDVDEHIRKDLFLDHCVICALAMAALAS